MKNCDDGSAYLQTLDTCFLKICSITELADEVQRLKLRNNQLEQQISALSKNDERSQTEDDQQ
jgi:cell division protein FtsB